VVLRGVSLSLVLRLSSSWLMGLCNNSVEWTMATSVVILRGVSLSLRLSSSSNVSCDRDVCILSVCTIPRALLHEPVHALYYNFHIICLFCHSRTCGNFKQWLVSGGTGKRDNWFENCCIRKVTDVGTYLDPNVSMTETYVYSRYVQFPEHFTRTVLHVLDDSKEDCWPNSAWIITLFLS
jgi:hypothetical protein